MIAKAEIEERARTFEVHTSNVQRDYVFGWFLFGLFSDGKLKDILFLKGGNALRKGYFADTRFSADLDFGIPTDLSQQALMEEVNRVCDVIEARAGVRFTKESNRIEEKFTAAEAPIEGLRVYEVRIYFKDFYGGADHLKIRVSMDLTRFDKTLLPIQTVPLIHPYSDADTVACSIRCMKVEEIIATKLKCLLQRQHAPDLYDYVYSIRLLGGRLDRREVVRTFVKKTIFERNPQVVKRILVRTPFEFCRSTWNRGIVCAKAAIVQVEEAIAFFIDDLEDLFGIYPDTGFMAFAYFGADLRVPIMEAGRRQVLLKVMYKHENRLVEPYALKFMQRRDGGQREYFYVYNREGGSSPPGMRSFVAENVQSIELTDEVFEPRAQIELSKAGEVPQDRFLFDANRPARATRSTRRLFGGVSTGPKYIYQCTYCGRRFTKGRQSGTLRAHQDKRGHPCPGRQGFYVTMKM